MATSMQGKRNWLSEMWDLPCVAVEAFNEILALRRPPEEMVGKISQREWKRMKQDCLFQAIVEKKIELVSVLVEQPEFDVNANFDCNCEGFRACFPPRLECNSKYSPLHLPFKYFCSKACPKDCSNQNLEIMKKLLSVPGIDVNVKSGNGLTPLVEAIFVGNIECIKHLVAMDSVDMNGTQIAGLIMEKGAAHYCSSTGSPVPPGLSEKNRSKILKILKDAQLTKGARQEEAKSEMKVETGKKAGRKKKKQHKKSNEVKVEEKEDTGDDMLEDLENIRGKLPLLRKEEEGEREKINLALLSERNALSALGEQVEASKLEKSTLEKEMKEIELALNALLQRKSSVGEKQKAVETKVAEIEKEKLVLKQNVAAQVRESESKIALIQSEIKIAKLSLDEADCKNKETVGNRDLENFLEGQILELESELECPVCLEVATTSPIYKCIDDHLLYRDCRPKLTHCPLCREALGDQFKRFRGGERQAEKLKTLCAEMRRLRVERGTK